jgi:hypothetical protein
MHRGAQVAARTQIGWRGDTVAELITALIPATTLRRRFEPLLRHMRIDSCC